MKAFLVRPCNAVVHLWDRSFAPSSSYQIDLEIFIYYKNCA